MPKAKSKKQIGLLLSSGSPLTPAQKKKLKSELHSGKVKVMKKSKKGKKGCKGKKGKGSKGRRK